MSIKIGDTVFVAAKVTTDPDQYGCINVQIDDLTSKYIATVNVITNDDIESMVRIEVNRWNNETMKQITEAIESL